MIGITLKVLWNDKIIALLCWGGMDMCTVTLDTTRKVVVSNCMKDNSRYSRSIISWLSYTLEWFALQAADQECYRAFGKTAFFKAFWEPYALQWRSLVHIINKVSHLKWMHVTGFHRKKWCSRSHFTQVEKATQQGINSRAAELLEITFWSRMLFKPLQRQMKIRI